MASRDRGVVDGQIVAVAGLEGDTLDIGYGGSAQGKPCRVIPAEEQRVGAAAAVDRVCCGQVAVHLDDVVAAAGMDGVSAGSGTEEIIAVAAGEHVVAR